MTQFSKPYENRHTYKLRDGREIVIVNTYIDMLESEPFQVAEKGAQVVRSDLVNRELIGDITDTEAKQLISWIDGGFVGRAPDFLKMSSSET